MKELLIGLTNEKDVFMTPLGADGEAIKDLTEYHVTRYHTQQKEVIQRQDILVFFLRDTITGELSGWTEQKQMAGTYDSDDEQMQSVWNTLKDCCIGSIDDQPADESRKQPGEADGRYFVGAYAVTYICWKTQEQFKAALEKNNPDLMKNGMVNIQVGTIDRSQAFYCYGKDQLQKAINDGQVYAYLMDSQEIYLPAD